MVSKKVIIYASILLFISVSIPLGIYFYRQIQQVDVRIGFLTGDLHQLAFYVAQEQDMYSDEDIKIQAIGFPNGNEVMTAFEGITRSIDMAYLGFAPTVYHRFTVPTANITILAGVNVNGSALVVKNDTEIQTAADLVGLRIAVPARHNMQDFILSMILASANLTHDDITVIVQSPSEMVLALQTGVIDGYIAWEPFNVKGIGAPAGGKYLYQSADVWSNHPCCVIASHTTFTQDYPEYVEKVLRVHKRATEWILSHEEDAIQLAMVKMNLSYDQAQEAISHVGYVYDVDMPQMVEFVQKLVDLNPNVDLNSPYIPNGSTASSFTNWFVDPTLIRSF